VVPGRAGARAAVAVCAALLIGFSAACSGGAPTPEQPSVEVDDDATTTRPVDDGSQARRGKRGDGARKNREGRADQGNAGAAGGGAGAGGLRVAYNNGTALERTPDGTLHAVWVDAKRLTYARYLPDGTEAKLVLAEEVNNHAVMATDGDSGVVVVWNAKDGTLYAASSSDGGESFAAPVKLAQNAYEAPSLRVWRTGVLTKTTAAMAIWHDGLREDEGSHIYTSTLSEGVWTSPVQVDTSTVEAKFASIDGQGDMSVAVWRETPADGSAVSVIMSSIRKSPDAPWSPPVRVAEGLDPSVSVDAQGWIHVALQSRVTVKYSRSTDGGATFSAPTDLGPGLFGRVVNDGAGHVAIAWEMFEKPETPPGARGDRAAKGNQKDIKSIGVARSSDHGNNFEVTRPVDKTGLLFATIAASPSGALDLMYVDSSLPAVKIKPLTWE
jgi:hypothetical protein